VLGRLQGFDTGSHGSEQYARLALALLAHGRKAELPQLLATARSLGPSPELDLAQGVYGYLATRSGEPRLGLRQDPTVTTGDARARALLSDALARALAELAAAHYAGALGLLEAVPARLRRDAGGEWALLEGYLRYQSGDADGAIDVFEDLLRAREGIALEYPELHYFLARAHDSLLHFDKAVRNMRVYVTSRAYPPARSELELTEPGRKAAPTSDAPDGGGGGVIKDVHATR